VTTIRTTEAVAVAGEAVTGHAQRIQQLGDDMYAAVKGLLSSEQLAGAVGQALEASHGRWNSACAEFAAKERQFGQQTMSSHENILTADDRGAAIIQGA
jgi:hypothetical protein